MKKLTLGERMKMYESYETNRCFLPTLPVYARLDGRAFHSFTRGMNRPYDSRMSELMIETTKYLVEYTHAKIGYTQSDEISLVFYSNSFDSQIFFDRNIFKMTSILASMATAKFTMLAMDIFPDRVKKMLPTFDCRVISFPNRDECVNMLIWRVRDAIKNSISMASQHYYSDSQLHGVNSTKKLDMLIDKGVNWNDYPRFFKEGVFVQRKLIEKSFSDEELAKIPEKHRPSGSVIRSVVVECDIPPFQSVKNKVEFIFDGEDVRTYEI